MKKLLFLLAFLISIVHVSPAQFSEQKMLYLKKVKTYKKMRNIGVSMIGLGVIGTVAGISVISNEIKNDRNNIPVDDSRVSLGLTCIVLGVPLTAGGMVVGLIGHHKVKKYMHKMEGVTLNLNYSPQSQGLTLRYTF
jgi:hypothetical protein